MSKGTSEMTARSTPERYAETNEVSPLYRPKTSTTARRSCDPALVRSWWMKLTVRVTAVEKPMQ
jgi:hypothetical protein